MMTIGRTSDPAAFWRFSLAYYARPGTAEVCLALQDDIGVDVNVMLFLLWQAQCGRRIGAADIRSLMEFVAEWRRHVVQPLRGVRRFLKNPGPDWTSEATEALRQRIKDDELSAEQMQQLAMARAFPAPGDASDPAIAARDNLCTYVQLLDGEITGYQMDILVAGLASES